MVLLLPNINQTVCFLLHLLIMIESDVISHAHKHKLGAETGPRADAPCVITREK